jgi:hypothetical protein
MAANPETESPSACDRLMEEVCERGNLQRALKRVKANKGAPGVDGMTVQALPAHLREHWPAIRVTLLNGTYRPQPVRRVEIPKPDGGGVRKLGIPSALDRLVQQAVLQVLQRQWDPTFSDSSYGFRPGRSAHQAVERAQGGLRFGRYADDCNVYVRSERAGQRVMAGLKAFLTGRLKLKVNESKSAVAPPHTRKFLGFTFLMREQVKRRIAPKALARFKARIRELTQRTRGVSVDQLIGSLKRYLTGWRGYFGFCETPRVLQQLDQWIRRRLRCFLWKQWKRGRTRFKKLVARGVSRDLAAQTAGSPHSAWRLSCSPALSIALPNRYFRSLGLPSVGSSSPGN